MAKAEGLPEETILIACLLHDVGRMLAAKKRCFGGAYKTAGDKRGVEAVNWIRVLR